MHLGDEMFTILSSPILFTSLHALSMFLCVLDRMLCYVWLSCFGLMMNVAAAVTKQFSAKDL